MTERLLAQGLGGGGFGGGNFCQSENKTKNQITRSHRIFFKIEQGSFLDPMEGGEWGEFGGGHSWVLLAGAPV